MAEPFPEIEPYDHGMLDVGDGNSIYWETVGNPPVQAGGDIARRAGFRVFAALSGGCSTPRVTGLVLFDQRNCGRSTPHAGDPGTDLASNTTQHLVADIERLREHLGDRALAGGRRFVGEHTGAGIRGGVPAACVSGDGAVWRDRPDDTRSSTGRSAAGLARFFPCAVGAASWLDCPRLSGRAMWARGVQPGC